MSDTSSSSFGPPPTGDDAPPSFASWMDRDSDGFQESDPEEEDGDNVNFGTIEDQDDDDDINPPAYVSEDESDPPAYVSEEEKEQEDMMEEDEFPRRQEPKEEIELPRLNRMDSVSDRENAPILNRPLPETPPVKTIAQTAIKQKLSTRALHLLRGRTGSGRIVSPVKIHPQTTPLNEVQDGSAISDVERIAIERFEMRFKGKKAETPRLDKRTQAEDRTFAGKVRENIKKFFKYNKTLLVREKLSVEEIEKRKARTWVLILVIIQIVVCVGYGVLITQIPKNYSTLVVSVVMAGYFILKLLAVLGFTFQRGKSALPFSCQSPYDASQSDRYKEVFICIPAYNEGKDAFLRTIDSIVNSNYPKEKIYMLFIVDGNKQSSFENLMEVLLGVPWDEPVKPNTRILESGIYGGVAWSVFLKEENRGKRDSQWLFVEILRNLMPEIKPTLTFFVDSDTAFSSDSMRFLHDRLMSDKSGRVAGVCGQLQLSNFDYLNTKNSAYNIGFNLTNLFIVGYQLFEYHFNQILGKQAEACFGSVTCLPGAFSMFRTRILCDIEVEIDPTKSGEKKGERDDPQEMSPLSFLYVTKVKDRLPLILNDFFSKPTIGIIERNLYELGEDRTLTIRILERGLTCLYEPNAIAYTECPDSLRLLMLQRRRWNNSTFINLVMMLIRPKLWTQLKTFPIMVFSTFDLVGAYLMPTNAVLLMSFLWEPLFLNLNKVLGSDIHAVDVIFWWLIIQFMIVTTTTMATSDYFYVGSAFMTGILMMASLYFFISELYIPVILSFVADPINNWPLFSLTILFPALYLLVSIPKPLMFITAGFYYVLFPTSAITMQLYSFIHLDDFSWGNR